MAYTKTMQPSLFADAVVVSPCETSHGIGMLVGNHVLTAAETQVYKRIESLVEENKKLKSVLMQNSYRIQDHYDACVKWKDDQKMKEDGLKVELVNEKKQVEILSSKLQSYDAALRYGSSGNSWMKELDEFYDMLEELLSEESVLQEDQEEVGDFVIINQAVQETQSILSDLKKYDLPTQHVFEDIHSKLTSISEKYVSIRSPKFQETMTAIQDTVYKHSLTPVVNRDTQQVPLVDYVQLKAQLDLTKSENHKNSEKLKSMDVLETHNEELQKLFESGKRKVSQLEETLKKKTDQIKSMELKIDEKSVEVLLNPDKKVEDENKRLKSQFEQLKLEYNETQETFAKVDEENTTLREDKEHLTAQIHDLKNQISENKSATEEEFQQQTQSIPSSIPSESLVSVSQKDESLVSVSQKDVEIGELQDELTELKSQLEVLETEKSDYSTKCEHLQEEQTKCNEKNAKMMDNSKKDHQKQMKRLKGRENRDIAKLEKEKELNYKLKAEKEESNKLLEQQQELISKEQQEKLDELTAQVIGGRDLIETRDAQISDLNKKITDQERQMEVLKDQQDEIPILKMQMDVYHNDFNAEREAREKLHADFYAMKQRMHDLSIENYNLKEQLQRFGNQPLNQMQMRHGVQSPYEQNDRRNQAARFDRNRTPHSTAPGTRPNANLYGRGGENRNDAQAERSDDTVQRKCPKCDITMPDLDTLQIHLMECLDETEGVNPN